MSNQRLCEGCGSAEIKRTSGPEVADGWIVFGYKCDACSHEWTARVAPRTDFARRAESFAQRKDERARFEEIRAEAEKQASARDSAKLAEDKRRGLAQLDAEIAIGADFDAAQPLAVIAERGDLALARGSDAGGVIRCRCGATLESGPRDLLVALWSLGHLPSNCDHVAETAEVAADGRAEA